MCDADARKEKRCTEIQLLLLLLHIIKSKIRQIIGKGASNAQKQKQRKQNKTAGRKNKKGLLLSATCNMECLHYYCGLKTGAQPQTHPNPGVIENGKRPDQRRKDFSFTFEPIDKAQGSERN
jgi:hypothetical protein